MVVRKIIKAVIKPVFPIINAFWWLMGVCGVYFMTGGKLTDKDGPMIILMLLAMLLGAIVGYMVMNYKD